MAQFIEGDQLNTYLTDMISNADRYLWFVSPYIKLNERTKFNLAALKKKPEVEIVIVFGKNEADLSKSVSLNDLLFFKEFPNIRILHVKNLHAKYYGSENFAIITSMNLYEFSQVNNLEAGVALFPKNPLKKLTDFVLPEEAFDNTLRESVNFFQRVINQGHLLYEKKPIYKTGFLGLSEKYEKSEVLTDTIDENYQPHYKSNSTGERQISKITKPEISINKSNDAVNGYCIRTGVKIPFDPSRPFSYKAYLSWAEFSNFDYPEKFCHKTGKPANGKTCMRNPILS